MIQVQCAFKDRDGCKALNDCNCAECSFFKTESELAYERELAAARIAQLPVREQIHIRRKYYGIEERIE